MNVDQQSLVQPDKKMRSRQQSGRPARTVGSATASTRAAKVAGRRAFTQFSAVSNAAAELDTPGGPQSARRRSILHFRGVQGRLSKLRGSRRVGTVDASTQRREADHVGCPDATGHPEHAAVMGVRRPVGTSPAKVPSRSGLSIRTHQSSSNSRLRDPRNV